MSPRFSVGEEVILQSKDYPKFNGEYVVTEVLKNGESFTCRITGRSFRASGDDYIYRLEGLLELSPQGHERIWAERALRKKYKPSDESFEGMIQKLKANTAFVTIN